MTGTSAEKILRDGDVAAAGLGLEEFRRLIHQHVDHDLRTAGVHAPAKAQHALRNPLGPLHMLFDLVRALHDPS